jgi:hypothetical protein
MDEYDTLHWYDDVTVLGGVDLFLWVRLLLLGLLAAAVTLGALAL